MRTNKLSFSEARKIPITEYLTRLGFEPSKPRGNSYWYLSPFRTESEPSFKVDVKKNVWYDHGEGEGGTVIDFAAKFHKCTPYEALEKLSGEAAKPFSFHRPPQPGDLPESKVEVLAVRHLTSPGLLHYLHDRGIDAATAQKYCVEIDFRIGKLNYTTIGFANRSGGYDLRARSFKGSSSPKDVTLIGTGSPKLCVLEGFIDFLSVLKLDQPEFKELIRDADFLILNSVSLLKRSFRLLKNYSEINLFLDNDLAAKKAKEKLTKEGIRFYDASSLYGMHKDVNDHLVKTNRAKQGQELTRTRSARMKR